MGSPEDLTQVVSTEECEPGTLLQKLLSRRMYRHLSLLPRFQQHTDRIQTNFILGTNEFLELPYRTQGRGAYGECGCFLKRLGKVEKKKLESLCQAGMGLTWTCPDAAPPITFPDSAHSNPPEGHV